MFTNALFGHAHHESFEQVQARRPDFKAEEYRLSKQPNPNWKPGQGLSQSHIICFVE